MSRRKMLGVAAGVAVSFAGLAGAIVYLAEASIVSPELAKLMLVALLALYVGFGFLIAVYRFIDKLD